jgi:hypothetical protein
LHEICDIGAPQFGSAHHYGEPTDDENAPHLYDDCLPYWTTHAGGALLPPTAIPFHPPVATAGTDCLPSTHSAVGRPECLLLRARAPPISV